MFSIRMEKGQCSANLREKMVKKVLKHYRPVSLLPITTKIFETIIYNRIMEYLIKNSLLTGNHSGFKP